MQKITPHLWYDTQAKEAAELYTSAFAPAGGARIVHTATIHDTPSGSADIVTIELLGQELVLISAGPYFKLTPAVSFFVACRSAAEVDSLWEKLSQGGMALMELGEYPFSKRYGWLQDKYGLSWQLSLSESAAQRITPMFLFVGKQCGRAEEAIKFYASVFRRSKVGDILRYGAGEEPEKQGTVKYATFNLEGMDFAAMESGREHAFTFNEAVSFMVKCGMQDEIDYYWERLSADPDAEQCGWLKDKFTVSWQIVPSAMDEMLRSKDQKAVERVTQAFLKMKKFDLAALKKAYAGNR